MKNIFYLFLFLSYYGQAQENLLRPEVQAYIDSIELVQIQIMGNNNYSYFKPQEKYDTLKEMIYPSEIELLKKSTKLKEIEIASRITAYYKIKKIEAQIAERNYKPLFKFLRLPYNPAKNKSLEYSMSDPEYKIRFFKKIQKKDLVRFLKHRDPRVQLFAAVALTEEYEDINPILKQFPKFLTNKIVMSFRSGCVGWSEYMSDYIGKIITRLHPEFKAEINNITLRTSNKTGFYFSLYAYSEPHIESFSAKKKQLKILDKEFKKTRNIINVYPLIVNNPDYDIELLLDAIKKEFLKEDVPFSSSISYENATKPLATAIYGLMRHNNKNKILDFYSKMNQFLLTNSNYRDSISKRKMQIFYEGLTYLDFNVRESNSPKERDWIINSNKRQQSILEEAAENKFFIKY